MKRLVTYIQQHLSLRLGLLILLIVGCVFGVTLGLLFYQTKQYVRQAAVNQATDVLDETVFNISGIFERTELATTTMERRASMNLHPDSLLYYTRRMVEENPVLQGFMIALEPNYSKEFGTYFAAYSYRKADGIHSMFKKDYDYTQDYWYKTPLEQKKGCWLEPYEYAVPDIDTKSRYYFSFTAPLYGPDGRLIGAVCSDLSLYWLSHTVTAVKPFPHSSAIMLGHDGRYIVHPDTAKQVRQSIFSDPDPQARKEVIRMGQSMLAGQSGDWAIMVDGHPAHVFYRPLRRTGWSIAIVCPDRDVFDNYNRMLYVVWAIIGLFLLLLLLFCYQIIRSAVVPVNLLAESTRYMASRQFTEEQQEGEDSPEQPLTYSKRVDTVGQLQNSFVRMQQSLNTYMSELHQINDEMEQRNKELQHANQLVREADERKNVFIQNMTHQVRTPLNIINGFTQVLASNSSNMRREEIDDIISHMKSSAKVITRITRMLIATSSDDATSVVSDTVIVCNTLCREVVSAVLHQRSETLSVMTVSSVSDDFTIRTDRNALSSILTELLSNAVRFAPEGTITLSCYLKGEDTIAFAVSDMGPGIAPDDRDRIFTMFTKLDSFTEGIGLGLPLSRHTANLLGGDLVLDDTYTDGTRFVLTLPINNNV